jgi:Fic/DOC family
MSEDWDADSDRLLRNLKQVQARAAADALARKPITLAVVKRWHQAMMRGLHVAAAADLNLAPGDLLGAFRGPPRLAGVGVRMGSRIGVPSSRVHAECQAFARTLAQLVKALDAAIPVQAIDAMTTHDAEAVIEAVAWAHSEWVRIHPFVNGNGRIARLIGNALLVRYGLPPVLRLRPRPKDDYIQAASRAMVGDQKAMVTFVKAALQAWTP